MPAGDRYYLIATLAAIYPDGSVGYVTGVFHHDRQANSSFHPPQQARNDQLDDMVSAMLGLYRSEIGEAYAMNDFTFTVHEAWSKGELFALMGHTFLARDGVSGTKKPNVSGSGLAGVL